MVRCWSLTSVTVSKGILDSKTSHPPDATQVATYCLLTVAGQQLCTESVVDVYTTARMYQDAFAPARLWPDLVNGKA